MRFHQYKTESIMCMNYLQQVPDELNALKVNAEVGIENSDIQLDNVVVTDSLNKQVPLYDFFKGGNKRLLVCRFSELYCESCVEYSIKALLQWVDSIGENNILFLGSYRNSKIFNIQKKLYGIEKLEMVNAITLNLPVEDLGFPYYFVLDSTLRVCNVSIPDKSAPNVDYSYFKKVYERFFQQKGNS